LKLAGRVVEAIVAHARAAAPAECCGVLIGRGGDVVEAVPTRNDATAAGRFLISPKDHIDARRAARRRGLEIVGFYHSHPNGSAAPSPTDLAEAAYPGHLYAIVGLAEQPFEFRLYRFAGGWFENVAFAQT
jgi:proteasome lid subunit RPN8/RPN11